ncbi:MAG: SpoIIE family protein phosphatase [Bdellovibrionaceae bacterium]|nr:SpoIIE family protein phosphatase [Pseudobdellovibrionaceae bacterium]
MPEQNTTELQNRIRELEAELAERTRDLAHFREELARANVQLEKFIQQIGQELKTAALIQKALVPTEFPNIPGFEFSTKFVPSSISGGDYFDIFEHEDKFRFGIVVANSSGYGMSALFLSVLLKMTGQLEARKGGAPEKMLEFMARELIPHIQGQDKANVFYAIVDRRGFDLKYSCAGRVKALLFSYGSNKLQRLETGTEPFQSGFQGELKSGSVALNPRDRLILCTEGVLKATNPKGELFGEERLYKAILAAPRATIHDLRNEIFYQIEKFCAGRETPQDITVVVAEVKDRVIKLAKSTD